MKITLSMIKADNIIKRDIGRIGGYIRPIIEFVINESPIFIISFLALVVVGLALVFGLLVVYKITKNSKK